MGVAKGSSTSVHARSNGRPNAAIIGSARLIALLLLFATSSGLSAPTPDLVESQLTRSPRFEQEFERLLADLTVFDVLPVAEVREVALNQRMLDGEAAQIRFEVSLGHIGLMFGSVWQHVIPRTVLGRPRTCHGLVPCLTSLKVSIDFDDHAAIVELVVVHHVANRKPWVRHSYHGLPPVAAGTSNPASASALHSRSKRRAFTPKSPSPKREAERTMSSPSSTR